MAVESSATGAIAPGDSGEQRAAQRLILEGVEQRLGVTLVEHVFDLGDRVRVQINGYTAQPPTLVEAWAHIGPAKSAQKHKIMMDALKMDWLRRTELPGARCVLAFADEAAASAFSNPRMDGQVPSRHGDRGRRGCTSGSGSRPDPERSAPPVPMTAPR